MRLHLSSLFTNFQLQVGFHCVEFFARSDAEVCLCEERFEDLGAVVEDAADVGGDEDGIDQGAAEDRVVHVVGNLCAAILCDEAVFVAPKAIGAAELFIDEAIRRIPCGDFAFPRDGDAVEAESVADVRAGFHHDWIGRNDLEFEEGWSEAFEIVGVGEEGEHFVDGAGEEDGAVDGEGFHGSWTRRALDSIREGGRGG